MLTANQLLPELDDIIKHGDPQRRAVAIQQIAALFLQGSRHFQPEHVDLFDSILLGLVADSDLRTRAELAESLSLLANAPPLLVKRLIREDEIRIAGPLLQHSPLLDDPTLLDIARARGQGHLLAISQRSSVSEPVTDVLIRRGDREVIRKVGGNAGALFSHHGYSILVKRASDDGILAMAVGLRPDLSDERLRQLIAVSVDIVRRRLFQDADPTRRQSIARAIAEVTGTPILPPPPQRDFAAALETVLELHRTGKLTPLVLMRFAKDRKYEESVVVMAVISGLAIDTVDQLMGGERRDSILILGRALNLDWPTMRAVTMLRLALAGPQSVADTEETRLNFERIAPSTAQRVIQFWKTRQPA